MGSKSESIQGEAFREAIAKDDPARMRRALKAGGVPASSPKTDEDEDGDDEALAAFGIQFGWLAEDRPLILAVGMGASKILEMWGEGGQAIFGRGEISDALDRALAAPATAKPGMALSLARMLLAAGAARKSVFTAERARRLLGSPEGSGALFKAWLDAGADPLALASGPREGAFDRPEPLPIHAAWLHRVQALSALAAAGVQWGGPALRSHGLLHAVASGAGWARSRKSGVDAWRWLAPKALAAGVGIDDFDRAGRSALHVAAGLGIDPMVEAIAASGADLWLRDSEGLLPEQGVGQSDPERAARIQALMAKLRASKERGELSGAARGASTRGVEPKRI